ncbi:hypothetical protein DY245_09830 [Streptomyces inhibens]|uniref:Uncharacterized protein n=1 Tax=Streptomyces inhibens TaxID=2293571 RepID=A0A371Q707_STRIH|nr:hypothetical protein [Streptomyces inhibens]REK90460.1 hypothetical protein DY245_09830 [Streptomyces inhibens]
MTDAESQYRLRRHWRIAVLVTLLFELVAALLALLGMAWWCCLFEVLLGLSIPCIILRPAYRSRGRD